MKFTIRHSGRAASGRLILALAVALVAVDAQDTAKSATHGIAVANIDRAVKPGDNFFLYANGEWIKRTEIPPDRSRVGVFSRLDEISSKRTAELIGEAVKSNAAPGTGARKIADLYNSYMDEAGIEARDSRRSRPGSRQSPPFTTSTSWQARSGQLCAQMWTR